MVDPVIAIEGLGKSIKGRAILAGIDTRVAPGEVIGVLGRNGAGKTTLLEAMLGFSPASTGSIRVYGQPSFDMDARAKARIGYVPQQDELVASLTGEQQLDLVGSFHGRWRGEQVRRLAGEWGIPVKQRITSLSGGERQKLSTLLALGHEPDLLVLDEPVASLDPLSRRQFLQQLLELAADPNRTVIFSTHIVSDIERVATRLWILREGHLVWDGPIDAIKEQVVRLHLRADGALPARPAIDGLMRWQPGEDGRTATASVRDWGPARAAALAALLAGTPGATFEVETMGLEDIFLEMHA